MCYTHGGFIFGFEKNGFDLLKNDEKLMRFFFKLLFGKGLRRNLENCWFNILL